MRALTLEPAARPRSAQAFAAELLAAVAAET
jgi:hypothetical protein